MHVVGANACGSLTRGRELETDARESGMIEEIRLANCVRNPQRSASMFDLILYELCRTEPNLTLMLNTTVVDAELAEDVEPKRINAVIAERQSTLDRFRISANIVVDCTGDGRLGVEAGAPFMEGREDRNQFNESLALESADNFRLGSTILIQARKHDGPMPFVAPPWARKFTRDDLRLRLYATPGAEQPSHEYGYWWAEWGGTLDTIRDNEMIRDELLAITLGIWDHMKNGPPGSPTDADPFKASHWALEWIGFLPGKRESLRFIGQHVLTENDVLTSRHFPDAIAYGGWPLDLHPPEGVDAVAEAPCEQHAVPWLYDIPLRACVSRDISNLMFAGRNLSATHVAFASTRVMATCAVVGQGVGTAAAFAISADVPPHDIAENKELIRRVQQQLLRDDAFLIGVSAEDELDLARGAAITASSEMPGGEAHLIISGQTRSVHGERGAQPDRSCPGTHRWRSDPDCGLPAWIELRWQQPVRIRQVQLVFDTGLHRLLTLSHHDGYTSKMHWGRPQPETISDYEIQTDSGSGWQTEVSATSNYQRLRRHRFEQQVDISAMRVHITATNGLDHARICEVRVYS